MVFPFKITINSTFTHSTHTDLQIIFLSFVGFFTLDLDLFNENFCIVALSEM